MDIDYLGVVLRWMHILAATAAAGGTFFMRLALLPSVSVLPDEQRKALHEQVRSRWSKVVMLSIGLLLVSGLINVANSIPGKPPLYHALFTFKFVLALVVFFVASALMGRSPGLARIRQNARFWLSLNATLIVIIICLSGVLRAIPAKAVPAKSSPSAEFRPAGEADGGISLRS